LKDATNNGVAQTKKGNLMQGIKLVFFGPVDLIARLEKASWVGAYPNGQNFCAISLAGYCLTIPADELCPSHYTVTVKKKGTRKSFSVEGFSYRDLLLGIQKGPPAWKANKIFNRKLLRKANKKNPCRYVMEVCG
jgi:hypothetical protein